MCTPYYIICNNNMALTYTDGGIYLAEYIQADNQCWKITFEE